MEILLDIVAGDNGIVGTAAYGIELDDNVHRSINGGIQLVHAADNPSLEVNSRPILDPVIFQTDKQDSSTESANARPTEDPCQGAKPCSEASDAEEHAAVKQRLEHLFKHRCSRAREPDRTDGLHKDGQCGNAEDHRCRIAQHGAQRADAFRMSFPTVLALRPRFPESNSSDQEREEGQPAKSHIEQVRDLPIVSETS